MRGAAVHIGELAKRTGASPRSLRYYEQQGLLRARRTEAGWREYDEEAVIRVRNVRELLRAGMTVDDIRQVADCLGAAESPDCDRNDEAVELHEARLKVIDARMAALQRQRDHLTRRIARLRASRPDTLSGGRP
ncbi:MerR family transcriptional regulator [Actinomadura namibiensis]|uniref:DNA-binding transcriptional MerR regulator n=1 Tax=Actinomadura namibiensis TaxID=182080 RepID=A0A7W3QM43_ACTNM|nr:MerR family transcriptional regulator [Actinomadura namibiensis]MBA8952169.1 DNA-binding transcriptional MerR regulator [Actinomadura namibiensis]